MKRVCFYLFLFFFGSLILRSQDCELPPHNNEVLAAYGIKKIFLYLDPYSGPRELQSVIFINKEGCPWKELYRDDHGTFNISKEKGSWQSGKKEFYRARLNKDSSETLTERRIEYYDNNGAIKKEEKWIPESGRLLKYTTINGKDEPAIRDTRIFVTNEKGDTLQKTISKGDRYSDLYLYMKKENGVWVEEQKTINKRDKNKRLIETGRWVKGKLVEGRRYKITQLNATQEETVEYDFENNPLIKTVTSGQGNYKIYEFKNGEWALTQEGTQVRDEADPVGNIDKAPVEKKEKPLKKTKKIKKAAKAPPVEKLYYRDPAKKDEVIIKEKWTVEGIILESDVIWDKKKWVYEYEYFK